MCRAVFLIIKPIVFFESRRCGRRRSSSLTMVVVVVVVVMMQPLSHFFRETPGDEVGKEEPETSML